MLPLGLNLIGRLPASELAHNAKQAEDLGFSHFFIAEVYFRRDGATQATALALATQKINVFAGVFNPHTRNPALTAMTIAALDELSNGRAILAIGAGGTNWMNQIGVSHSRSVGALREYVEAVRLVLSGKKIDFAGKYYQLKGVELGFEPRRKEVPIYMCVIGPKMLDLAGELAQGIVLTACAPRTYLEDAVNRVRLRAEKVGRNRKEITLATAIPFAPTPANDTIQKVKDYITRMTTLPELQAALNMIESGKINEPYAAEVKSTTEQIPSKEVLSPFEDAVSIAGPISYCKERIQNYRRLGIDVPILIPFGPIERTLRAFV